MHLCSKCVPNYQTEPSNLTRFLESMLWGETLTRMPSRQLFLFLAGLWAGTAVVWLALCIWRRAYVVRAPSLASPMNPEP